MCSIHSAPFNSGINDQPIDFPSLDLRLSEYGLEYVVVKQTQDEVRRFMMAERLFHFLSLNQEDNNVP